MKKLLKSVGELIDNVVRLVRDIPKSEGPNREDPNREDPNREDPNREDPNSEEPIIEELLREPLTYLAENDKHFPTTRLLKMWHLWAAELYSMRDYKLISLSLDEDELVRRSLLRLMHTWVKVVRESAETSPIAAERMAARVRESVRNALSEIKGESSDEFVGPESMSMDALFDRFLHGW